MSSDTVDEIQRVLKSLGDGTPGVEASAIVSVQGLPIASAMPKDVDDSIIAAMSAAILGVSERAASELARGKLQQILIQGDQGYVILKHAGEDALLTVMAKSDSNLGMIFIVMKGVAQKISLLLAQKRIR
ncbi:MAG: roadblock/LC7 domain-containing protein [Promethearchaeati archaeon SRVP18_Atabeyarchaeia-1]